MFHVERFKEHQQSSRTQNTGDAAKDEAEAHAGVQANVPGCTIVIYDRIMIYDRMRTRACACVCV